MSKPKTENDKKRLQVLWVLLNISTDYKTESSRVVSVMKDIETTLPEAKDLWEGSVIDINVNGEKIYTYENLS